jgi:MerR family transcriptional regulator/heat shock protein HspR
MADDALYERPVYVISVAAELASMHPQTLRLYERRGLLRPQRQPNNRRMYSQHDVERLRHIQTLTDTGLNLAGVERVLALEQLVDRLQSEMAALRRQLDAEAQRLRDEVARVERTYRRDLVPVRPGTIVSVRRSASAERRKG